MKKGQVHHIEYYVNDLEASKGFWDWFMPRLGYEKSGTFDGGFSWEHSNGTYLVFVQVEAKYLQANNNRQGNGLNHIAFMGSSLAALDDLQAELEFKGIKILKRDNEYLCFEDPNGFALEVYANKPVKWNFTPIKTERLILRKLTLEDASDTHKFGKSELATKYTTFEPDKSLEDAKNFIKGVIDTGYSCGVPKNLGITLKADSAVIGGVGCWWRNEQAKTMEVGYILHPNYWGRGIMVEATKALFTYVFNNYDVHKILARCKAENTNSSKVMTRLGMSYEGTLRAEIFHRGRYCNVDYYSVLKEEWDYVK